MGAEKPVKTQVLLNFFFFFNDTATTEIYTLSLHDAFRSRRDRRLGQIAHHLRKRYSRRAPFSRIRLDRKSTRLNSSHHRLSYAVFCLTKQHPCAGTRPRADSCPSLARRTHSSSRC